jgi:hypothetical protein
VYSCFATTGLDAVEERIADFAGLDFLLGGVGASEKETCLSVFAGITKEMAES